VLFQVNLHRQKRDNVVVVNASISSSKHVDDSSSSKHVDDSSSSKHVDDSSTSEEQLELLKRGSASSSLEEIKDPQERKKSSTLPSDQYFIWKEEN